MLQTKTMLVSKEDFPILKTKVNGHDLVYLDNAASSQKPAVVIDAVAQFYSEKNSNVHRGIHHLSTLATMAYEDARKIVANFLDAKEEEIIFTKGTTDALNILARSLSEGLVEGDEILLTEMEHHSNIVPWQEAAKRKGLVVKYIPVKEDFTLDMEVARELITSKTKIVSFVHVSNTLGTINPVYEIASLAKGVGALVVLDAAQSVPHMGVKVSAMKDVDFVVFSGHKMLGPTGVGVLYGKKTLLENMSPVEFGGGMIKKVKFDGSTWADVPEKFEAGTPNIAQAVGLGFAVSYLEKVGMHKIEEHQKELTVYAQEELLKVEGLKLFGPKTNRAAVFSFSIEGIHPHDLSEVLNRYGVAVRAGHHCTMPLHKKFNLNGTTRASFYLYNTKEDVDALIKGLEKAKEVLA